MKKILVVDDSDSMTDVLRIVLEDEGFAVLTAENGEDGYRQIREHRPDLLIVNLRMPKMDGWALIETIRRVPSLRELPVIVCSASRDLIEARSDCPPEGCAVFQKPFEMNSLLATIRLLLGEPIPAGHGDPITDSSWLGAS